MRLCSRLIWHSRIIATLLEGCGCRVQTRARHGVCGETRTIRLGIKHAPRSLSRKQPRDHPSQKTLYNPQRIRRFSCRWRARASLHRAASLSRIAATLERIEAINSPERPSYLLVLVVRSRDIVVCVSKCVSIIAV
jgi:hypothetical protein